MENNDLIEKQSELIDKLLNRVEMDNKYSKLKDCVIAGIVGLVVSVFIFGYWFSDTNYDNYINNNNKDTKIEMKGSDING